MKLPMVKISGCLVPDGTEAHIQFDKISLNKRLMAEITQPRNYNHHKLYFALCARIASGIGQTTEWVSDAFKIETGHFTQFSYGGKQHIVLASINFQKMDQIAFSEFFERCCQVAYERWKIDPASVADLLVKNEDQKRG